jgi:hypothetical protein
MSTFRISCPRILKLAVAVLMATALVSPALAQGDGALTTKTFQQLFQQIRPQAGESRWLELPWLIDLHAARQKAAAEGKPLFVLSGGGATGIGAC